VKKIQASRIDVQNELWRRGEISWILYPHQRPIYQKIREVLASDDPDSNSFVIDCSRQYGKSFTMFLVAVEDCIRNANWTIVFIAPLKSQVNEIINGKTFGTIFATCPKTLVPTMRDSALVFPNGSRIRLAGTDNHNYENLRGGAANTIFLDEAGFMSDLESGVLPTVEPMTKTTGGKVIYASTPPESLDHDYHEVLRYHEEAGLIATYTIWDDRSLTETQLQKIINQCRGRDTTKFKREFECQRIADSSRQILPNFTESRQAAALLPNNKHRQDQFYRYWDKYVVADWGGRDKTAIIFSTYNYRLKRHIVETHLDLNGEAITPSIIASQVKDKLQELGWDDEHTIHYWCDNNNPLIQQAMNITYRLPFVATSKGRLDGMVEKLKDWEYDDRIQYGPDAEFVLKCVASGNWTRSRDEFAKSRIYGHYDALAAMVYLIRNTDEIRDPVPRLQGVDPYTTFVDPLLNQELAAPARELQNIFNPRRGLSFRR
jgi:hypothetical protein